MSVKATRKPDLELLLFPYSTDKDGERFHRESQIFSSVNPVIYAHGTNLGFDGEILGEAEFSRESDEGRYFNTWIKDKELREFFQESANQDKLFTSVGSLNGAKLDVDKEGNINTLAVGEVSLIDTRLTPNIKPRNVHAVAVAKAKNSFYKANLEIPNYITRIEKDMTFLERVQNLLKGKNETDTLTVEEVNTLVSESEEGEEAEGQDEVVTLTRADLVEVVKSATLPLNAKITSLEGDMAKAKTTQKAGAFETDINSFLSEQLNLRLKAEEVDSWKKVFMSIPDTDGRADAVTVIKAQISTLPTIKDKLGQTKIIENGTEETKPVTISSQETKVELTNLVQKAMEEVEGKKGKTAVSLGKKAETAKDTLKELVKEATTAGGQQ